LAKKFDILILDEPTNHLDDVAKENLLKIIDSIKIDKIVIISSHDDCFMFVKNVLHV